MINGRVEIQWLDVNSKISITTTVKDLFKRYSDFMVPGENPYEPEIRFNKKRNPDLKVRDLFGWSKVLCIKKKYISDDPDKWCILKPNYYSVSEIVLTNDSLVPIYSVHGEEECLDESNGYHGATLYGYRVRSVQMTSDKDRIRVMSSMHDTVGEGCRERFYKINVLSLGEDTRIDEYGYEIYTKSGFYNASYNGDCKFHLFASENKINGNKIMYK